MIILRNALHGLMVSMLMDELDERGVLILSLWFVSIVSLLHLQSVVCNFLTQDQNGSLKVLSGGDM